MSFTRGVGLGVQSVGQGWPVVSCSRGERDEKLRRWMSVARGGGRIEKKEEETAAEAGRGKKGPTGRRGCTCHVVARPYKADDPEETRG